MAITSVHCEGPPYVRIAGQTRVVVRSFYVAEGINPLMTSGYSMYHLL
jgi:hypothetical protein